ncbi:hypothetical protein [Mesorhizobium sp.]|uniref:hypothetical protein n=1 Tax=Mesorhizobium sp. TaxID=1871066 RepID=UPI000FE45B51|nr:hypothetical protein [Mesorhizobium sp.]RWP10465.1 MAG: hypothetical protein EOQ97_12890 [Mesorhizobium sp.]
MSTMRLHDKRGIPIAPGDVLKVFHFIGARRKRHYMYKQCLGFKGIGPNGDVPYMKFGHLNLVAGDEGRDAYYLERPDGRTLPDYEIVQSILCDHDRRPRLALSSVREP